jgi:hypothetical protein
MISDEEKKRRAEAVKFARALNRIAGLEASPSYVELAQRFVEGELTMEEFKRAASGLK